MLFAVALAVCLLLSLCLLLLDDLVVAVRVAVCGSCFVVLIGVVFVSYWLWFC